jgi:hypothetical protein
MGLEESWKKSTFSHGNGGNCVEAQRTVTGAAVRDTQNRHLGHLEADHREWIALLSSARAEFS